MTFPTLPPSADLVLQRPVFDALCWGAMLLLVIAMSGAWLAVLKRVGKPAAAIGALALAAVVCANIAGDRLGWFARLDLFPPPFIVLALACLGTVTAVACGHPANLGTRLLDALSLEDLIALQIFRLPLELVMLRAAHLGIMPTSFSLQGFNLDILTGTSALVLWVYCHLTGSQPIVVIRVWNAMGMGFLLIIGLLAVLTSPNVHALGIQPSDINSWVLYFPYSLLPTVLVSFALLGHVLLTRKLARKHST